MGFKLKKNMTILFQGDSVTDCGRTSSDFLPLGFGYAYIVSSLLSHRYPDLLINFQNRGISGNRTIDLLNRWDKDCIDLKPDVLSILIGVNNTWRRYDSNDPTSEKTFHNEYHSLLTQAKEKINPIFVICEPFLLPYPESAVVMREDLEPKIKIIKELADEFSAIYIPYDSIFNEVYMPDNPDYWSVDGVHPNHSGHGLMAENWIKYAIEE